MRRLFSRWTKREPGTFNSFIRSVLTHYNRVQGPLFAKGLGFSFVFGGVPLLFLSLSAGAYFFRVNTKLQTTISELFLGFLPEQAKADLLAHIIDLTANPGSLGIVVIVVFVITSLVLFDSLERTMSTMLKAPRRRFLLGRSISVVLMAAAMLLFYVTAGLSAASHYFSKSLIMPPILAYLAGKFGSLILVACIFFLLFQLFSRRKLRIFQTFGVAILGAFVWEVIGMLGAKFIQIAGRRFIIYGAVAWAVMYLMYMRILGEIVVFSSILVGRISPPEPEQPTESEPLAENEKTPCESTE